MLPWKAAARFPAGNSNGGVLSSVVLGGKLLLGDAGTGLKAVPFGCCGRLCRGFFPYQAGQVLQDFICDLKRLCFTGFSSVTATLAGSSHLTVLAAVVKLSVLLLNHPPHGYAVDLITVHDHDNTAARQRITTWISCETWGDALHLEELTRSLAFQWPCSRVRRMSPVPWMAAQESHRVHPRSTDEASRLAATAATVESAQN
ncbi:uncharacterized protein [Dermacentor andersoni]|uniref:uncharacterized protein n=1 Tax=Dermacentor andersoni TaxID=34620 RepID=UPI0024162DB9|nr:uncharacterized protein LOC129387441 [Dermacentor andersoni]